MSSFEERLGYALRMHDTEAALRRLRDEGCEFALDADGFRIASLMVARLRFERLVQGSREAAASFELDPQAFSERFRLYHGQVPMSAESPAEEAVLFARWLAASNQA